MAVSFIGGGKRTTRRKKRVAANKKATWLPVAEYVLQMARYIFRLSQSQYRPFLIHDLSPGL
jgi:hypothetical protein